MFWKRGIQQSLAEVAGVCYCMAAIDGEVTDDELRMIRDALAEFGGGNPPPDKIEILLAEARKEVVDHGIDAYLEGFGRRLNDHARELVLAAAGATLIADGKVHERETGLFLDLAQRFGFSKSDAADLLRRVVDAANEGRK
jgi:tellurite resistance protein